jgi:hypothetical protein
VPVGHETSLLFAQAAGAVYAQIGIGYTAFKALQGAWHGYHAGHGLVLDAGNDVRDAMKYVRHLT